MSKYPRVPLNPGNGPDYEPPPERKKAVPGITPGTAFSPMEIGSLGRAGDYILLRHIRQRQLPIASAHPVPQFPVFQGPHEPAFHGADTRGTADHHLSGDQGLVIHCGSSVDDSGAASGELGTA